MNLHTITIFTIASFLFHGVTAQQVKTYSGAYKGGSATYQYYEDKDLNWVLNGAFKYSTSVYFTGYGQGQGIKSGKYKNNLQDGFWKFSFDFKDENFSTSGNFKNGLKEGEWVFFELEKASKKIIRKSIVHYNKDILFGTFQFICNSRYSRDYTEISDIIIYGKLNNVAKMDSIWIIKFKDHKIPCEYIKEYRNGSLVNGMYRDLSDGSNVKFRTNADDFAQDMKEYYSKRTPHPLDIILPDDAIKFWNTWTNTTCSGPFTYNPLLYFH